MSYPGAPQIAVGEYDRPLYYNAGTSVANRSLWILGIRPDGSLFGGPASMGQKYVNLPNQTMAPGEWVAYVIEQGDLTMKGLYYIELWTYPETLDGQLMQSTFMVAAS